MAEGIDGNMHLGTFAALMTIVAGARATFRRRLHRAAVHDHRTRLSSAFLDHHPQDHAQVVRHGFKNACFDPCLLYTSDAADERSSVDLGGRRIIKKKK